MFLRDNGEGSGGNGAGEGEGDGEGAGEGEGEGSGEGEGAGEGAGSGEGAGEGEGKKPDETQSQILETLRQQGEAIGALTKRIEQQGAEPGKKEFTMEELRDLEMKVHSGELDQKWLPIIGEKRAKLIANDTASETIKKQEVLNAWQESHVTAADKYDDMKDANSELFKRAQTILHSDPGYKRYAELKEKGIVDLTLIDPNLPEKAADQAYGQLSREGKAKPKSKTQKKKTELDGNSLPAEHVTQLNKLRDKAVESGARQDWQTYIREKTRLEKQGAGQTS